MYRPYGSCNHYNAKEHLKHRKVGMLTKIKNSEKYENEWDMIANHFQKKIEERTNFYSSNNKTLPSRMYWLGFGKPSFLVNNTKYYTTFEEIEQMRYWKPRAINITTHDLIFSNTKCFKSNDTMMVSIQKMIDNRQTLI